MGDLIAPFGKTFDEIELERTRSRLAAMTALAKEMQEFICFQRCPVSGTGHSPECLSFQQRIKEIEEQG